MIKREKEMTMERRIGKLILLEWGWHKIGDPSKPKSGLLWGNSECPQFYLMYYDKEELLETIKNSTDEL